MFLQSEIAFVAVSVALVVLGLVIIPNRSHFLLAAGVMTIAWQGGVWVEYFNMDFTLTYFIFGILLVWNFVDPQRRLQLKGPFPMPLYFWIGVIVFCAFSFGPAIEKYFALSGVARTVLDVIIFFAVLKALHSTRDVQYFVGTLMAAMIFQGLLAIVQFKIPNFKIGVIDETQSWMWWRSKGTFFHANQMGMYLLLMLPITARFFFSALMKGDHKWIYFSGTALVIGGFAIFTTANRGSWVGLAIGIVVMLGYDLFSRGVQLKKVLLGLSVPAMILVTIFALKYGSTFSDRLFSKKAEGMWEGRKQLQAESFDIIKAHPIFGVGYWNYHLQNTFYFVHNMYLLVAAEVGIPGLIFMAGFLLAILLYIIKGIRSKIFFVSNLSRGCLATLVGFLVSSIPGPDFWINHAVQMYFWMVVALQVALLRLEQRTIAQLKIYKQRSQIETASQARSSMDFRPRWL
jgi:putative inorganic carbon (HCO3(-)) transporter